MLDRLTGKVAVVTGASRGIGRAIALRLAQEGAAVVINYNGSKERAQEVKTEIESAGGTAQIMQCDVADAASCDEMFQTIIKEFGRIDILVNNAGITRDGLLMKMAEEDFDAVIDTNLKGTFHCIRAVSRQMLRQRSGRIINLSSVSGVLGNAGQANYSASKAGVIGLTKSAARELASRGITVNAIAPGFFLTEQNRTLMTNPDGSYTERAKSVIAHTPFRRLGTPEELFGTIQYLISDASKFVTGTIAIVDGGFDAFSI